MPVGRASAMPPTTRELYGAGCLVLSRLLTTAFTKTALPRADSWSVWRHRSILTVSERSRKFLTGMFRIIPADLLHKPGRLANFFAPGKNSSRHVLRNSANFSYGACSAPATRGMKSVKADSGRFVQFDQNLFAIGTGSQEKIDSS